MYQMLRWLTAAFTVVLWLTECVQVKCVRMTAGDVSEVA